MAENKGHILLVIVFLLFSFTSISQNINGKIYDEDSVVRGAKITNMSHDTYTFSDDDGNFMIVGKIGDTLSVSSLFHRNKTVIIQNYFLDEIVVIQIQKLINDLDEVLLSTAKVKSFDEKKYTVALGEQLERDKKLNPHQCEPPRSQYGIDFMPIIALLGKLLKKKKVHSEPVELLSFKQLDSLFREWNHQILNEKFLTNNLHIPFEYKPLVFDYCDTQGFEKVLSKKKTNYC